MVTVIADFIFLGWFTVYFFFKQINSDRFLTPVNPLAQFLNKALTTVPIGTD